MKKGLKVKVEINRGKDSGGWKGLKKERKKESEWMKNWNEKEKK